MERLSKDVFVLKERSSVRVLFSQFVKMSANVI